MEAPRQAHSSGWKPVSFPGASVVGTKTRCARGGPFVSIDRPFFVSRYYHKSYSQRSSVFSYRPFFCLSRMVLTKRLRSFSIYSSFNFVEIGTLKKKQAHQQTPQTLLLHPTKAALKNEPNPTNTPDNFSDSIGMPVTGQPYYPVSTNGGCSTPQTRKNKTKMRPQIPNPMTRYAQPPLSASDDFNLPPTARSASATAL